MRLPLGQCVLLAWYFDLKTDEASLDASYEVWQAAFTELVGVGHCPPS